jgi:hypothetical protein
MTSRTLCPACERWIHGEDTSPPELCPSCSSPVDDLTLAFKA